MNRRRFNRLMAQTSAALLTQPWNLSASSQSPKPIRFSFMLWALEKQASFDDCLEIVAAAGYQGIELVGEFQKWSDEGRKSVMARMRGHGMIFDAMSGVRAGFAVPQESEAFLNQFSEHLRFAQQLECPQVILLSGRRIPTLAPGAQHAVAIENLKRAAEMADKVSIEVVIEPIDLLEDPSIFLATVADAFDIVQMVDAPHLKVLYDLYHEQRSFGNLMEKLENNIRKIGLIHIADVPGRHEPGTGEIDYTTIYRRLAELRYDRWIAMEYYPTSEPVASLRNARQTAQRAIAQP